MSAGIPTIVLGGTGYVAGELLRLIAGHPNLKLAGILSDSQPGEPVAKSFGHLAAAYPDTKFSSIEEIEQLVATLPRSAIFSAAPHGASAALIDRLLTKAEAAGTKPSVVDISADYRYCHGCGLCRGVQARAWRAEPAVAVHLRGARASGRLRPRRMSAHPGCFATAILLASVPLLKLGIATPHAVRQRRDRQHRLRPQARRRHASSAAAQRHVRLQRAGASACAGSHRLREGRQRRGCALRVRAALRPVRARHPCDGAGAAGEAGAPRPSSRSSSRASTRTRPSSP